MFRMQSNQKKSKDSKGMTYAEIAVCLLIVAIVVTPLSASLISSTKVRVQSESIRESTLNAEALLEDVKLQISKDIDSKVRREGNRAFATDPYLLINNPTTRIKYVSTKASYEVKLEEFLQKAELDIKNKYSTDRYAYEVAVWNAKNLPTLASGALALEMNEITLLSTGSALKICSTTEAGLNFDSYGTDNVINYDMTSGAAKIFKEELLMGDFIPTGFTTTPLGYALTDVATIGFNRDPATNVVTAKTITYASTTAALSIATQIVKDNASVDVGYIYKITDTTTAGPKRQGTVVLDLRQLVREFAPPAPPAPPSPQIFKFTNATGYPIVIKVVRNCTVGENLATIDSNINIIIDEKSTAETVIERIEDIDFQDNYIIAVIVRDKNPRLGQRGKIIKKMVDVYSYTPIK